MVRFVNIRDLHARTPKTIESVAKGDRCVITKRGKPKAILLPLNEEDIEDLVLGSKTATGAFLAAEREANRKGWKALRDVRKELGLRK